MVEKVPQRTLKSLVDLASMHSITSDSLIAMSKGRLSGSPARSTRARLDRKPRYVCAECGHAVCAPRKGRLASLAGATQVRHKLVFGGPVRTISARSKR